MTARVPLLEKYCLACNKLLVKKPMETPSKFNLLREYCSKECRIQKVIDRGNELSLPAISEERLRENIKNIKKELASVEQQWFTAKEMGKLLGIIKS